MARLHFDLLQAVLDADISAAATTITFTAPLKEWGEDLIPTVASPDIVAVRVGYELMHITAYTSGASSATVLRGQEGSTATTHNEGDAVRAVPTAADFLAISPVDSVNGATGTVVLDAADVGAVATTGAETIAGVKTFSSDPIVPDEAYGVGWNGSLEPPTKNAVYDKIETIAGVTGVAHKSASRTAGDVTLNSSGAWANVDTGLDLVLPAAVGDDIEVSLFGLVNLENVAAEFDVVSVVSAAPVNSWVAQGAVTAGPPPGSAWYCGPNVYTHIGSPVLKSIVSGDLSGGNVTLRLRYSTSAATNKTLFAATGRPFRWIAKNLGPPS